MKPYKDKVFHVISNTHWDREWRFPYQRNRQMLVDMIDEVLRILSTNPAYKAFHLDSQSVVLEDYFEVRPEQKKLVTKLVKQKKLFIGPWYILPDEFLVGGENLVRNLLLGHKICGQYGKASKIGYSPFSWGQISQLPQIYREFGVELIMFYRGVNSLDSHNAEFMWVGADGEKSLASRFSTMPRYNFYFYIYRPVVHNETPHDVAEKWSRGGVPFHFASGDLANEDYFTTSPAEEFFPENVAPAVENIIEKQVDDFTTPHVIWMEGHDSSGPNEKTTWILSEIRQRFPDLQLKHSTLEEYARCLKASVDESKLPLVHGERRSAQYDSRSGNLYGYVTSARMYLKQKNFEAEKWLQYYAEPWVQLAALHGANIPQNYIDIAWKYLLQNSAHDSIGGCSLDEIHEDMMWRYKQTIEIAKGSFERALKYFIKNIDMSEIGRDAGTEGVFLTVFNPLPYKRQGYERFVIDIPVAHDKGYMQITSGENVILPLRIIKTFKTEPVLEQLIDRPMYYEMQRYEVELYLPEIPAMGYETFLVTPVKPEKHKLKKLGIVKRKGIKLENELVKISVHENGTFDLFDKICGVNFKQLAYLTNEGEAGHAWVHKSVEPVINTLHAKPEITLEYSSDLSAEVRILHKLKLPKRKKLHPKHAGNSVNVVLSLRLEKNSPAVKLSLEVENNAENHRLRIMFPTGISADHHFAEGQFDVVQRSNVRPDTKDWVEQPMYDYPAHHFIDISGTMKKGVSAGLALFNNGLKEYECMDDKNNTIALTLLRAFTYVIQPSAVEDYSHQPGAQCLGKYNYEMALRPHAARWQESNVFNSALQFSYPVTGVQSGKAHGILPSKQSFIEITNSNIIYSALKKSEDGLYYVARLHNPDSNTQAAAIKLPANVIEAWKCTLEEIRTDSVTLNQGNVINITIPPKKIFTLAFRIK